MPEQLRPDVLSGCCPLTLLRTVPLLNNTAEQPEFSFEA